MPSTRPIKLDGWGISKEEYKELYYFCLQYERKKREADALLTLRLSTPTPATYHKGEREYGVFLPHGSGATSDPTAATAERRERYLRDIRMIDQAANEAAGYLAPFLICAVTSRNGTRRTRADMRVPCGERQFYEMRRKFFWILHEMKSGGIEPLP